jgi:hypothetical protein
MVTYGKTPKGTEGRPQLPQISVCNALTFGFCKHRGPIGDTILRANLLHAEGRMRRLIVFTTLITASLLACGTASLKAGPTSKPASADAERLKWMNRVIFFGDEATGEWSLRIHNRDVDTQRQFKLRELWTYNRDSKHWERMGTTVLSAWMLPPGKVKQDPADDPDPDPTEILAELPIEKDEVGLFYAKWTVDDVEGATFCRVGTGLGKKSDYVHKAPPEGKIWVVLPIDQNHSVPDFVPNPQIACKTGK